MIEQAEKQLDKEIIYVPVAKLEPPDNNGEIDLVAFWEIIWKRKFTILVFSLLCTTVAIWISLYVLPVTYKSYLVLQSKETNGTSNLSEFAANMPIDFPLGFLANTRKKDITIISFLNSRIIKERLIKRYDLLPKLYPREWDEVNQKWLPDDPKKIPTVMKSIKQFKKIYIVDQDQKTGLITISWIDKDPEFAKIMLERIVQEVQDYFENEYESDAKREYDFVQKELNKVEEELKHWENKVPSNKLTLSKIRRELLASETVYTELRKQLELAKIAEVKEVINFKILDPPFVPEMKFKPKRALICGLTMVVSGALSIFLICLKQFITNVKAKSKSSGPI